MQVIQVKFEVNRGLGLGVEQNSVNIGKKKEVRNSRKNKTFWLNYYYQIVLPILHCPKMVNTCQFLTGFLFFIHITILGKNKDQKSKKKKEEKKGKECI